MSERSTAYLKNKRTSEIVEAILIDGVSRDEVAAAQAVWAPTLENPEVNARTEHSH